MYDQQADGPPTDEEYIENIIAHIRHKLIEKRDEYRSVVEQAGGWEGKFQADVQNMFESPEKIAGVNDLLTFDHEVTREERIFADSDKPKKERKRADTPAIGIEMKVSSAGQGSTLPARFKNDIIKCGVGVDFTNNAIIRNAPALLWLCVGVTHALDDMYTLGLQVPTKREGDELIENEDTKNPQKLISTLPPEGADFSRTEGQFIALKGKNVDRRSLWLVWAWKADDHDAAGEFENDVAMASPVDDNDMDVDDDPDRFPTGKKPSSKGSSTKGKGKQKDLSTAGRVASTSKAKKIKASSAVLTNELGGLGLDDNDMEGTGASTTKKQPVVQKKKTDKKKAETVRQLKDAREKPVKKATTSSSGAAGKVKTKAKSSMTG